MAAPHSQAFQAEQKAGNPYTGVLTPDQTGPDSHTWVSPDPKVSGQNIPQEYTRDSGTVSVGFEPYTGVLPDGSTGDPSPSIPGDEPDSGNTWVLSERMAYALKDLRPEERWEALRVTEQSQLARSQVEHLAEWIAAGKPMAEWQPKVLLVGGRPAKVAPEPEVPPSISPSPPHGSVRVSAELPTAPLATRSGGNRGVWERVFGVLAFMALLAYLLRQAITVTSTDDGTPVPGSPAPSAVSRFNTGDPPSPQPSQNDALGGATAPVRNPPPSDPTFTMTPSQAVPTGTSTSTATRTVTSQTTRTRIPSAATATPAPITATPSLIHAPIGESARVEREAHRGRADSYLKRGQRGRAIQEYELVLRLDPDDKPAQATLTALAAPTASSTQEKKP